MSSSQQAARASSRVYLVGGGIASLAAAAFLIRDADIPGHQITIFEELGKVGGSLDGSGSPADGYVIRGGRMFESKYLCTYDLFSSIPTLDASQSVTDEIMQWNRVIETGSKARLVRLGQRLDAPAFGLSEPHILTLERLALEPEALLGTSTIADQFTADFFQTNFWLMWCTTFAFQPWHSAVELKRYLLRFTHMVEGFNTLHGIMRTVYNQYDSMVRPLRKWLDERGVNFEMNTLVSNITFDRNFQPTRAQSLHLEQGGSSRELVLGEDDYVIATLGSMTEASSLGGMDRAPVMQDRKVGGAWALWENIAAGRPEFGHPAVFCSRVKDSRWVSFTTTFFDKAFFSAVRDFTGNVPGEGGLITLADSNWLMSIVLPYQPHFAGQPENVEVLWGYGLFVDKPGNFVQKPMAECTGREIMIEVMGHLGLLEQVDGMLEHATCIPCMMPFITSQFLPRKAGDRPQVVPKGARNFAFTGQFCEIPDDVVFTVEYSVRSAQQAVSTLFATGRVPPAVYKGQHDPRVLYKAFTSLHAQDA